MTYRGNDSREYADYYAFADYKPYPDQLPEGLTTIYDADYRNAYILPTALPWAHKVFGGCSTLVSANYPVNWVNSPSGNGSNSYEYGNVFSGCPKLTEIEIPEGVKVIAPINQVTFALSLTEIVLTITLTSTQIIRDRCICCTNLTSLTEITFAAGIHLQTASLHWAGILSVQLSGLGKQK